MKSTTQGRPLASGRTPSWFQASKVRHHSADPEIERFHLLRWFAAEARANARRPARRLAA